MFFHATKPDIYLIHPSDLKSTTKPPVVCDELALLETTINWLDTFIAQPHPALGRPGDICPFVRDALNRDLLWFTIYRGPNEIKHIIEFLTLYQQWFKELARLDDKDAEYKTILALFPGISPTDHEQLLTEIRSLIKPQFLTQQLNVGVFHIGRDDYTSVRNPEFLPMHSPIPMYVFRNFVLSELMTLNSKLEIQAWLSLFQNKIPKQYQAHVDEMVTKFQITLPVSQADLKVVRY